MKKRIAFLGLSYPFMFDTTRRVKGWLGGGFYPDHPVIGGGNGLIILYDEIWFLTRLLCPVSMLNYSFVKFVDEMDFVIDYDKIIEAVNLHPFPISDEKRNQSALPLTPRQYASLFKLSTVTGFSQFESFQVGNTLLKAGPSYNNYMIDFLITSKLQEKTGNYIELVSNLGIPVEKSSYDSTKDVELVSQILVDKIPECIDSQGPCSPDIWKLRDNIYLKDFRKWIVSNHEHIQTAEISEMKKDVQYQVDSYRNSIFLNSVSDNSYGRIFLNTGINIINAVIGSLPVIGPYYSAMTVAGSAGMKLKDKWSQSNNRWTAFVASADEIAFENQKSQ